MTKITKHFQIDLDNDNKLDQITLKLGEPTQDGFVQIETFVNSTTDSFINENQYGYAKNSSLTHIFDSDNGQWSITSVRILDKKIQIQGQSSEGIEKTFETDLTNYIPEQNQDSPLAIFGDTKINSSEDCLFDDAEIRKLGIVGLDYQPRPTKKIETISGSVKQHHETQVEGVQETYKNYVDIIMNRYTNQIHSLYMRQLHYQKDLNGSVKIKFTIAPNGTVQNVEIVTAQWIHDQKSNSEYTYGQIVERSLISLLYGIKFPETKQIKPIAVSYSLLFEIKGATTDCKPINEVPGRKGAI